MRATYRVRVKKVLNRCQSAAVDSRRRTEVEARVATCPVSRRCRRVVAFAQRQENCAMSRSHRYLEGVEPWISSILVIVLIALVAMTLWLVHRRTQASDGLTPTERKALWYPEDQILSILRQNGAPMPQSEIVEDLPGKVQDLVQAIKSLEDKGLIRRSWDTEKSTYLVMAN